MAEYELHTTLQDFSEAKQQGSSTTTTCITRSQTCQTLTNSCTEGRPLRTIIVCNHYPSPRRERYNQNSDLDCINRSLREMQIGKNKQIKTKTHGLNNMEEMCKLQKSLELYQCTPAKNVVLHLCKLNCFLLQWCYLPVRIKGLQDANTIFSHMGHAPFPQKLALQN